MLTDALELDEQEFDMVVELVDSLYSGRHFSGNPAPIDTVVNHAFQPHLQGKGRDLIDRVTKDPGTLIYAHGDVVFLDDPGAAREFLDENKDQWWDPL